MNALSPPTKRVDPAFPRRRGYTLVELVVSIGAASILMAGMGSAVFLSAEAFTASESPTGRKVDSMQLQQQVLNDLRFASSFSERTANAVTFTVPDRTGDGRPDTIQYRWSGTPGDPLTYTLNGATPVTMAASVNRFGLTFQTQTLNAPVIPDDDDSSPATILFVSAGQLAETQSSFFDLFGGGGTTEYVVPTSTESTRVTLLEAAGYSVTVVADTASDDQVNSALLAADVVYLSGEIDHTALSQVYFDTTLGVVNESFYTISDLGFCDQQGTMIDVSLSVISTDHFITEELSLGPISPTGTGFWATQGVEGFSPDLQALVVRTLVGEEQVFPSLMALNADADHWDTGTVPGRRVHLPFGSNSFDPSTLSPDGLALMIRSIEWALGNGPDGEPNFEEEEPGTQNFGYESIFANSFSIRRVQIATKVDLPNSGSLSSISVYVGGSNKAARVAIYSDSAGEPAALLAQSSTMNSTSSPSWLLFEMPDVELTAGTYWLAVSYDNRNQYIRADNVAGAEVRVISNRATQNGFLNSWSGGSEVKSGLAFSIFGTVEAD